MFSLCISERRRAWPLLGLGAALVILACGSDETQSSGATNAVSSSASVTSGSGGSGNVASSTTSSSTAGGNGGSAGSGGVVPPLENAQIGDPGITSFQHLAFGPAGVLLIGDGDKDRIVAVATGDTDPASAAGNTFVKIDNIVQRVADAFGGGATPGDIKLDDIVVNPISKRVYLAATRQSNKDHALYSMDGAGTLFAVDLSNVTYATIAYGAVDMIEGSTIVEIAWTDTHVVASALEQSWTYSQMVTIALPFTHGAATTVGTTKVYHRAHKKWETHAPINSFTTYVDNGAPYIAGGFTCTPLVRYPVSLLAQGMTQAEGATPFDYGSQKHTRDLIYYKNANGAYLLANLAHFQNYTFAVRAKSALFTSATDLNETAPVVLNGSQQPTHGDVERVNALDNAHRIVKRDDGNVILYRGTALETVALP
ncbi:MAG: hypothetical protein VB934_16100 [Polyangiaceae bacterium]